MRWIGFSTMPITEQQQQAGTAETQKHSMQVQRTVFLFAVVSSALERGSDIFIEWLSTAFLPLPSHIQTSWVI